MRAVVTWRTPSIPRRPSDFWTLSASASSTPGFNSTRTSRRTDRSGRSNGALIPRHRGRKITLLPARGGRSWSTGLRSAVGRAPGTPFPASSYGRYQQALIGGLFGALGAVGAEPFSGGVHLQRRVPPRTGGACRARLE